MAAPTRPRSPASDKIEERIEAIKKERGDTVSFDEVAEIVANLLGSLHGDLTAQDLRVFGELESLAKYIYRAKQEISEICPQDISDEQIPIASVELDAIGAHLEEATGTILDACEIVEGAIASTDAEVGAKLGDAVTRIYEACNFQDLSGQRISKIVSTLQNIEDRVQLLIKAFDSDKTDTLRAQPVKRPVDTREGDAKLLNGPQTPTVANSQADIDALLASFD